MCIERLKNVRMAKGFNLTVELTDEDSDVLIGSLQNKHKFYMQIQDFWMATMIYKNSVLGIKCSEFKTH